MTGQERKRRITRTAVLLGVLALAVYGAYIALMLAAGGTT